MVAVDERAEIVEGDWVARFADEVIAEAQRRAPGKPIVCASGLSPSGPIHLGNLREVMTPHLVADEIRRRGHDCVHIVSWDDFDRFRQGSGRHRPASWAEHIGKPLSSVPAPPGSPYPNWAEHFKAPLIDVDGRARHLVPRHQPDRDVHVRRLHRADPAGHARAGQIDAILDRYRTKGRVAAGRPRTCPRTSEAAAEAARGFRRAPARTTGAPPPDITRTSRTAPSAARTPPRSRRTTTSTTELAYTCACGHAETVRAARAPHGKLVWKVDWPMRWAYEGVDFEPSGVDHSSPGSSFVVGGQIVGPRCSAACSRSARCTRSSASPAWPR